jgi:hypothetical protein
VPAIVEDECVVLPEFVLAVSPGADSVGVEVDREVEGKPEAPQAAGALLFTLGDDAGGDVEAVAEAIDVDRHGQGGRPCLGRQLERVRSDDPFLPVVAGLKGRQFKA